MKRLPKKFLWALLLTLLSTPIGFSQSVTPVAANQVNVTDGLGGYNLQPYGGGSSSVTNLPGTPNVVYSFVATGDQSCTASGSLTDISGHSNNATIGTTAPSCTGTGYDFSNSLNASVLMPTATVTDRSYCAAMYEPPHNSNSQSYIGELILFGANTTPVAAWSATLAAPNDLIYAQYSAISAGAQTQTLSQEAGFHVLCLVQGLSSNSTTDRLFTDGVENTYATTGVSGNIQNTGNMLIGTSGTGGGSYLIFYYLAGWAAQLTPAQVQQASNTIRQTVALRGVQTSPTSISTAFPTLLAVGDSITFGFGATTSWPAQLVVNSAYANVVNEGLNGYTAIGMNGAARWRDAPQCNSGSIRTLAIIAAGTNDLFFGFTAAQTMNNIAGWVNFMHAAGCQVGVATVLSRTGADAAKDAVNPLIRSNANAMGYFVVDGASVPQLGADGANANLTYFQADNVHPTNAGQILYGAAASNSINAHGAGAASSANPTIYNSNAVTMLSADVFTTIIPTAAATATLPDCLGATGTIYQIFNASAGANTITFSGKASEAITGSATLAQNLAARFQATLISQAAAGCGWQRIQ